MDWYKSGNYTGNGMTSVISVATIKPDLIKVIVVNLVLKKIFKYLVGYP